MAQPLPVVFIASSTHGRPIAKRVAELIKDFATPLGWWANVFGPTGATFQNLTETLSCVDAAVVVLTPDDKVSQHRDGVWSAETLAPRDNLVFENGMFIGALGRARAVYLEPTKPRLVLPTDLAGVHGVRYPDGDTEQWDEVKRELRRWLGGEQFKASTRTLVNWGKLRVLHGNALVSSMRGESLHHLELVQSPEARHSLLMIGNTFHHASEADQREPLRWLNEEPSRRIGQLFLNPHSPHAQGRDRPHLHRGAREKGLVGYRNALEKPLHAHYRAMVYEGPYRYSMHAIDAPEHTRNAVSEINLVHSTHESGIDGGFSHALAYHRGAKAFDSLADDGLSLWKSTYANPDGHGITLAALWDEDEADSTFAERDDVLKRAIKELFGETSLRREFYLNPPGQWHMTLCSLRRTGPRSAAPFSLSAPRPTSAQEKKWSSWLPAAFGEYVALSCQQLLALLREEHVQEIEPLMTHLRVTKDGHLIMENPDRTGPLANAVNKFLAGRAVALQELGLDATVGGHFVPKHLDFWSHVSIGMAFHNDAGLPEPLTLDEDRVVKLSRPLRWRVPRFHAVHYAYRTFRRNVGTLAVPIDSDRVRPEDVIWALRIG